MNRRELLSSIGGAGLGAAGGILTYELFLDSHMGDVYAHFSSQEDGVPERESFDLQNVSEVDVFLIAGQSNACGRGSAEASPTPPTGTAGAYSLMFQNGFEALKDPVGFARYRAKTGSAWPAFADTYWKETDSISVYVPTAIGATGLHPKSHYGAVWGGSYGLLYRALGHLRGALFNLEDAGITANYRGVLWHQGERDARAIDDGNISPAEFKAEFATMIDVYRSEIDDEQGRFWVFQIGRPRDGDTPGFRHVRRIQEEITRGDENTTLVFDDCVNFPDEGKMKDNSHYNQQGLNEMGRTGATTIVDELEMG